MSEFIIFAEAARRLGVSRQRLDQYVKMGRLRPYQKTIFGLTRLVLLESDVRKFKPNKVGRPRSLVTSD